MAASKRTENGLYTVEVKQNRMKDMSKNVEE